jgi:hypothetical protein
MVFHYFEDKKHLLTYLATEKTIHDISDLFKNRF